MKPELGASVVCMNPLRLQKQIAQVLALGVDYLHIDMMDGSRVERYGMYPEQIIAITHDFPEARLDIHLMVNDPVHAIKQLSAAGFHNPDNKHSVCLHRDGHEFEFARSVLVAEVHNLKVTRVVNPRCEIGSPAGEDAVMLMGCVPGVLFHSPSYLGWLVRSAEHWRLINNRIQVDGGVTFDTVPLLLAAGVRSFVCGSATLLSSDDVKGNYDRLRELLSKAPATL